MPQTVRRLALPAIAALVAAAFAGPLAAQETSKQEQAIQRTMETFDADKNGSIAKAEVEATLQAQFKALDKNGDGALSQEEFMAYTPVFGNVPAKESKRTAWLEKRFKRLDSDNDGKVTEAEFLAGEGKRFAGGDDDKDGQVTAEELRTRQPAKDPDTQTPTDSQTTPDTNTQPETETQTQTP